MLVLKRGIGQAVMIDDQFIVTVERFDAHAADLSLKNHRGHRFVGVTAPFNTILHLMPDVDVVYIALEAD